MWKKLWREDNMIQSWVHLHAKFFVKCLTGLILEQSYINKYGQYQHCVFSKYEYLLSLSI